MELELQVLCSNGFGIPAILFTVKLFTVMPTFISVLTV